MRGEGQRVIGLDGAGYGLDGLVRTEVCFPVI